MNEILNSLNKARRAKRLAESENLPKKKRKIRESALAQEMKNVTRRKIHEELEDPEETDQEYTSAETSINSAKLPAIYNLVKFKPGQVVLDYGGGKFDNGIQFLEEQGCKGYVYDPYNRDREYNQATLKAIREAGGADVVLISNVLNVINTASARKTTLNNAKRLMKAGGTCYITVYEGSGTGEGGVTQKGKSFQVNKKTKDYVDEIAEVFNNVTRKGKLIIAEGHEIKASKKINEAVTVNPVAKIGEDSLVVAVSGKDEYGEGMARAQKILKDSGMGHAVQAVYLEAGVYFIGADADIKDAFEFAQNAQKMRTERAPKRQAPSTFKEREARESLTTYDPKTASIDRAEFNEKFSLTPKTVVFTFNGWDGKSYDGETRTARIYKMKGFEDVDFIKVGKGVHYIDYGYMVPEKATGEEHPVASWFVDVKRG